MIEPNYVMRALVTRVIDGDTVIVDISPAFAMVLKDRKLRLHGINTAELHARDEAERIRATQSRQFVVDAIESKEVLIKIIRIKGDSELIDSFGRYLAVVYYLRDGAQINLNDELLQKGLAEPWARNGK